MAIWVLIGITVVMVLVLLVQLFRKKPVKKMLLSYVLILGGYYLYVTYTCGPNRADVKVMKPQTDAIVQYILTGGVSKPLSGLSGLPYQLTDCERSEVYWDKNNPYKIAESIEDSDLLEIKEKCIFTKNDEKYKTKMRFSIRFNASSFGELTVENQESETAIRYLFKQKNSNQSYIISNEPHFYSFKISGICNPMRQ